MSANRGPRAVVSRPASAPLGRWLSDGTEPVADVESLREALADLNRPVLLIESAKGPTVVTACWLNCTCPPATNMRYASTITSAGMKSRVPDARVRMNRKRAEM